MERLTSWICLTVAALATVHAQNLQLVGSSVVDKDFFVVGELQSGETLQQFTRRYRQQNPSVGEALPGSIVPSSPRVPTAASSSEPLGLSSGATEVLGRIDDSFSCEGLPYGYYSDSGNDCRVYHVCNPGQDGTQTNQYSFFCNAGLEFDQQLLTCVFASPDRSACSNSRQFYESSNSQFFRDGEFNPGVSVPATVVPSLPPTDGEVILISVTGGVPVDNIQFGGTAQPSDGLANKGVLEEFGFFNGDGRGSTDGAGQLDLRFGLPKRDDGLSV